MKVKMKVERLYKFRNPCGNSASVAVGQLKPYNEATYAEAAFVVSVFDSDGFMFFRSVYPSYVDAIAKLAEMGGNWDEIKEG